MKSRGITALDATLNDSIISADAADFYISGEVSRLVTHFDRMQDNASEDDLCYVSRPKLSKFTAQEND
jgi:hypothetical protein